MLSKPQLLASNILKNIFVGDSFLFARMHINIINNLFCQLRGEGVDLLKGSEVFTWRHSCLLVARGARYQKKFLINVIHHLPESQNEQDDRTRPVRCTGTSPETKAYTKPTSLSCVCPIGNVTLCSDITKKPSAPQHHTARGVHGAVPVPAAPVAVVVVLVVV